MAITTYFKTEKMPTSSKLSATGWLWITSTINQPNYINSIPTATKGKQYIIDTPGELDIYCHIESATEPAGDGKISTSDFNALGSQTDTEYSATGDPVWIKSFTSDTGIFTSNQDFGATETRWLISYQSKYANKTAGQIPFIKFYFYKRNASNADTLLFTAEGSVNSFYIGNGQSMYVTPTGSVATSDRLRIRVEGGEAAPV
ncbi:MAG: hypothetical protein U9O94_01405 [Nanoarchaeota archaeon]|nr:hypothetical protein [Nanoarchaeota archaeon]